MKLINIFIIILVLVSCDDFLTEEPENAVTNNNFWKNEKDVESAVYGMHSLFRGVLGSFTVLSRDRGLPFDYMAATWQYPASNQLELIWTPDNQILSWSNEYTVIAQANLIIDNIGRANLSKDRHDFYLGQAYTIRAYTYFYILRTWGDAPLITKSVDVGEKSRNPWQELAQFAINDLIEAKRLLPPALDLRDSDGHSISIKQIPSKGTAHAILSHLYAWKGSLNNEPELFNLAIYEADSVINSPDYGLVDNPKEVCDIVMLGDSKEGIFELSYRDTPGDYRTSGQFIAGACQRWPVQPLTTPATRRSALRIYNNTVYQLYPDVTDKRREEYFYKLDSMAMEDVSVTQDAAYINKWRAVLVTVGGSSDGQIRGYENNEILIRLADIILLRAELKAKTNDISGAITDLNIIRNRAGAKLYDSTEDIHEAIITERDRELFLESGIRYFDIIRNGIFREKLYGRFKTLTEQDIEEGAFYIPIINFSFNNNTLMRQTIYWKRNGYAY